MIHKLVLGSIHLLLVYTLTTPATQCDPEGEIDAVGIREKLLDSCKKLKDEEQKLNLLTTLQSKGLVTRDIMSFVNKQASIRTYNKWPDNLTARRAMSAKISDSFKSLQRLRVQGKWTKNIYFNILGRNRQKFNRLYKSIKREISEKHQISKNDKKIKHLSKIQKHMWGDRTPKYRASTVPTRLKEYSSLSIFKLPQDLPQPEELMDPFICHPKIKLNENELRILKKDPKFSLMDPCDKETFLVENELSGAKHRYGLQDRDYKNKKKDSGHNSIKVSASDEPSDLSDMSNLKRLWSEESHRFTYNPFDKTLDFRQRRPTDYKLNKRVILPRPLDDRQEFLCELKRRGFAEAFDKYESEMYSLKESTRTNYKKGPKCDANIKQLSNLHDMFQGEQGAMAESHSHNTQTGTNQDCDVNMLENAPSDSMPDKSKSKSVKMKNDKKHYRHESISNLSNKEQMGLNSLLKRIQKDEIRITPTDKSGRFAILTNEQYIKSGQVHTNKDESIGWKEVNYLRNQVNNHMF